MTTTLRINRIQRCCFHDGPGIRTTVFMQGCALRCWWCHNPEAQVAGGGAERAPDDLAQELLRDRRFWDRSGGGVTLSGGDPLLQAAGAAQLLARLGAAGVHRCVETAGMVPVAAVEALLDVVDLWLFDYKHADPADLRAATGADRGHIEANLTRVLESGADLRIRVPVIAGFNDTPAAWEAHAQRVGRFQAPVELLPGHDWGRGKGGVDPRRCSVDDTVIAGFAACLRRYGIAIWENESCRP
ncbi:MAG: radical SAM protein [Planctomycetota bacterium]|nr:radical SAM protein [Planctomycetota bacterium]